MIIMTYVCLVVLLILFLTVTISLAADDNPTGVLGGGLFFVLTLMALIGVIAR